MVVGGRHVNVHQAWNQWSEDQTLHVVAAYINPLRYRNRRELFHVFADHMRHTPNVVLHVVEVAYGERPFEVTCADDPLDIQLRAKDIMFLKENAQNIAFQHIKGWKYGAYVDSDFHFHRHDWALEAIHQLQHYDWVQLFSSYSPMTEFHLPMPARPSFAFAYHEYFQGCVDNQIIRTDPTKKKCAYDPEWNNFIRNTTPGATGGAWAFTRRSFDDCGGFLDTCILGAGDWYMSFGLVGNTVDGHPEALECGEAYVESIRDWQTRAFEKVEGNIHYVKNYATHGWHGDIKNRGYGERWKILRDFKFDPAKDLIRDSQGLYQWRGNKPRLRDAVNRYFYSRNEDSTELHTKPVV